MVAVFHEAIVAGGTFGDGIGDEEEPVFQDFLADTQGVEITVDPVGDNAGVGFMVVDSPHHPRRAALERAHGVEQVGAARDPLPKPFHRLLVRRVAVAGREGDAALEQQRQGIRVEHLGCQGDVADDVPALEE